MSEPIDTSLEDELTTATDVAATPTEMAVNAYRTDDTIVVVAACPGVHEDDLTLTVQDSVLTIEARLRTAAPKDYFIREWAYGALSRRLELPDRAGLPARASLGNGQLAVSLTRDSGRDGPIELSADPA